VEVVQQEHLDQTQFLAPLRQPEEGVVVALIKSALTEVLAAGLALVILVQKPVGLVTRHL
jgi:hypothetical protein